jgi:N-acetyl sugar amidotransferase
MIKNNEEYRICNLCVMDTTAKEITFDDNGFCNFCTDALNRLSYFKQMSKIEMDQKFESAIDEIKKVGKGNKYDCLIGLSGGVDSSYLAYLIVKSGLRPLAIHLDNGWNTELAVNNIQNIVNILGIDLYTHVIDWNEFKELQKAFLRASVLDLELLSDNAILVLFNKLGSKFNIKYLLGGGNLATESILPSSWIYNYKTDGLNIRDIYKKFGNGKKLKTYPMISFIDFFLVASGNKYQFKSFPLLDLSNYNKEEALQTLEKEVEYRRYPYKHYESKITQFYQAYILPEKWGIDKRKAHLSSLICNNEITRDEALEELKNPLYKPRELQDDIDYFIKKLELTKEEFDQLMHLPTRGHLEFRSYSKLVKKIKFWK